MGPVGRLRAMGWLGRRVRLTLGWVVVAVEVPGVRALPGVTMGRVAVGVLRGSMRRLRAGRVALGRVVWWWW